MRSIVPRARGYSLIELVVYLAIFGVVSVYALLAIGDLSQIYNRIRVERRVAYAGEVAMERIMYEVRKSSSADAVSPGIDSTGKLMLGDVGITPSNVTASGLIFTPLTLTGRPLSLIRIQFTVKSGSGKYEVSRVFNGSAIPRNGY